MKSVFEIANENSLLGHTKMRNLRDVAHSVANVKGAFAEFGVYKGGSSYLLSQDHPKRTLHLFDTFGGMPIKGDGDHHEIGAFGDTTLKDVQKLVPNAQYHVGLFPDTTKGLEKEKYAFAHIDADQEKSTFDACEYFYPRMATSGVMLFDDYKWRDCPGVEKALKAFTAKHNLAIRVISTNQAAIIKTKAPKGQVALISNCNGIGDTICGMYAAAGIAAAGYEVYNYTRNIEWLERASFPGVHNIDASLLDAPDSAIDIGARYDEQLEFADCRKQWYCDNFCIAKGLPEGSIKPVIPKVDTDIKEPRKDAGKYIVAHASSSHCQRNYHTGGWHKIVSGLNQKHIRTIAIDGKFAQDRLKVVFGDVDAERLCGQTPEETIKLMLQSKAVVGIDSGMTHVSALYGVPTICINSILPASMVWGYTDIIPIEPTKEDHECTHCRFGHGDNETWEKYNGIQMGCPALQTIDPQRVIDAVIGL